MYIKNYTPKRGFIRLCSTFSVIIPMDPSSSGFLKGMTNLGFRSSPGPDMSVKDKRYLSQVEKALATFDALDEWADYIAFLSRLQKALSLSEHQDHTLSWIPAAEEVSAKLALCLSPNLPNGVHQKALTIYDSIFSALTEAEINKSVFIWLPGLLPVVSYASMQVKPQLLDHFKNHILPHLEQESLKQITEPFILSLLAGMDDQNSEVFADIMKLMDEFKSKLDNSSHFWKTFFTCIISSPEKRMGALHWCNSRLPIFATFKEGDTSKFPPEAQACLKPEPGILARAFASVFASNSSFNQANDIIVMRGFFDLLLTHIPLGSEILNSILAPEDKELLVMTACKVTLKRDMSLNRRLWAWLLGPGVSDEPDKSKQTTYFKTNALPVLERGLLKLVNSDDTSKKVEAFRIALSLIMDRWEINALITPRLFVPIIKSTYDSMKQRGENSQDVLVSAKSFFDEVEASFIWQYVTCDLILASSPENSDILEFLLRNFNFPEEEKSLHVGLAIVGLLSSSNLCDRSTLMLESLVEIADPALFSPLEENTDLSVYDEAKIPDMLKTFYNNAVKGEEKEPPIAGSALSFLILEYLKKWYVETFNNIEFSDRISKLLSEFLYSIPNVDLVNPFRDKELIQVILTCPPCHWERKTQERQDMLHTVFGIVRLCRFLVKFTTPAEKSKILKIILSNLWYPLITSEPANNQVEAVRLIFDLELCFDICHIEAGILEMLLKSPSEMKTRSFYKLWAHSAGLNNADNLLSNPLHTVLDDLLSTEKGDYMTAQKFVYNAVVDGSANRLLMLITNPLLTFEFMKKQHVELSSHDDLKLFTYYLRTVSNVIKSNEKLLKDSFNHEFVVSESTEKFELIKSNGWDISNYKSLIICIIEKFLNLQISKEMLKDSSHLSTYSSCISLVLDLFCLFSTGSETDFENHFHMLVNRSFKFFKELEHKPHEIEIVEASYIQAILHFLKAAKSLNVDLKLAKPSEESKNPLLVNYIIHGISTSQSSLLLEKWLSLLTTSLYMFNDSIFSVILTINDSLIDKLMKFFELVRNFSNDNEDADLEACISILLSGFEDFLSICHSYLLTSNLRATAQTSTSENGFLGNMIQGVFQIESPSVRTEEQNRLYSILIAFRDASRASFKIWSWADAKPAASGCKHASARSINYLCTRLKFRSRKLLECLSDLEKQEIVETIIESPSDVNDIVKILHVLDGGRAQMTLPRILNSILTRCASSSVDEKSRFSLNPDLSYENLSSFLVPYFESLDSDTVNEIWEDCTSFFKDVLSRPSHYKQSLLSYLEAVKVLSLKIDYKRSLKRNNRELASIFMNLLQATINNRDSIVSDKDAIKRLSNLVEYLSDILQDSDKTSTAVSSIISAFVLPQLKQKSADVDDAILVLIETIGLHHPLKAWKQVISEVFSDNSFFSSDKFMKEGWKNSVRIWVSKDKEKMSDLIARVTPSVQSSAANIFIWNEHSEVEDRVFILKRISYLLMVQPKDYFGDSLSDLFSKLTLALGSSCPPLYKRETFTLIRAITLRFSEMALHSYWTPITQCLIEVFSSVIKRGPKEYGSLDKDELSFILSASKLLDQLLLIGFDEFRLNEWLFVSSVSATEVSRVPMSLIDKLAASTESLLTKEDPVVISQATDSVEVKSLLYGVRSIQHLASLKRFFGSLSYVNYERKYGLHTADIVSCETDTMMDIAYK
ncbi:putative protein dopey [Clavispora lusitaniae]|uniref:Uncharacterized protein n=1 Tax=Clavispora lusitaniae TaxID=36911 RepID=A0ACD0WFJ9_CLALS|nr:putative protein dopey [Clavispora lusitaniae]QFZ31930.1 putative protein dopey [Clavispora lusitaniae]QFZ37599.1 putative protein dopey [Clavispora lusitaniae]QFZ43283.1 putative protein dopey [Clavispora lusitaniae]QFZ48959.1 putative protein dopey [Clavispora lusitaniae]